MGLTKVFSRPKLNLASTTTPLYLGRETPPSMHFLVSMQRVLLGTRVIEINGTKRLSQKKKIRATGPMWFWCGSLRYRAGVTGTR